MISRPLALIIIIIPTNTLPSLLSQCLTINSVERKRKKYSSFWPQCNEKKTQKTTKNACCSFLDNKKQKVFFGDVWFFRLNDIYYWKRKIMSKTIIITIHFPILFIIIIISLFTFYLSFIFCAITLINSILKKNTIFLLSIYIFNFCFHIFSKFCLYTMIIENIKTTSVSLPTKEWLANNRNNFTK